jgi:outer membrane biosynthesis protein TonB
MNSEADPTDRIEAEASLFAPGDNHSEKGSMKAPSPEPDVDDDKDLDATPRPTKPDPLTMPTPKVTGAYVETPATVKVEKIEIKDKQEKPKREERPLRQRSASFRDKRADRAMTGSDRDTASDPGTDDKLSTKTSSSGVRRRRTRSLSQRRGTLKNSAKLPTVKDDLKELQRTHHIDDSTLDDLEEVILGRKAPSQEVEALLDKLPENSSLDDDFDFDLELDTKLNTRTNQIDPQSNDNSDLDRMTRMNNTLKNSLFGIHTAARGIERLSDQVSTKNKAAENKATEEKSTELKAPKEEPTEKNLLDIAKPEPLPEKMATLHDNHGASTAFITHSDGKTVSYVSLPLPELFRRKPSFRFTGLGLFLFLLGLWYALESTMCHAFCRPVSCSNPPCVWSVDDPTFGKAIPVKLDQWVTGGRGRTLAGQLMEEAVDWYADMKDVWYDREITDIDIHGLSFDKKRQHRRRLRKKGLLKRRVPTSEERARLEAWKRSQEEEQRQQAAREMGYEIRVDDDETVGGDTRVW